MDGGARLPVGQVGGESPSRSSTAGSSSQNVERGFALLSTAARLARAEGEKLGLAYDHDWHRVASCCWSVIQHGGGPSVAWNEKSKRAGFRGIVRCANAWACPICSRVIMERNRRRISRLISWANQGHRGLKCVMVTLTFPHTSGDGTRDLLAQHAEAMTRFRAGRSGEELRERFGLVGFVRALELQLGGRNGAHPHTHELWVVGEDTDAEALRASVVERWAEAWRWREIRRGRRKGEMVGRLDFNDAKALEAFRIRSVDIHDNATAGDYLAKLDEDEKTKHEAWAADREMAGAAVKGGKGRSPLRLLADAADADLSAVERREAGRLYIEAIDSLRGRPPIYWSQGLRALAHIDEATDAEVVAKDCGEIILADLGADWAVVRRHGRAAVLNAANEAVSSHGEALFAKGLDAGVRAIHQAVEQLRRSADNGDGVAGEHFGPREARKRAEPNGGADVAGPRAAALVGHGLRDLDRRGLILRGDATGQRAADPPRAEQPPRPERPRHL
jgi:hypothetical protein